MLEFLKISPRTSAAENYKYLESYFLNFGLLKLFPKVLALYRRMERIPFPSGIIKKCLQAKAYGLRVLNGVYCKLLVVFYEFLCILMSSDEF